MVPLFPAESVAVREICAPFSTVVSAESVSPVKVTPATALSNVYVIPVAFISFPSVS